MQLIDTHSHLYEPEFDDDRDLAVARAREAGVKRLLFPAIDSESHERMFEAVRRYGDYCVPMMGLHPTSINDNPHWQEDLAQVERYLKEPPAGIDRFCAVGEIGLDFYWSGDFRQEQQEAFVRQCRLAAALNLPVAIHSRSAWREMEAILGEECHSAQRRGERLRGVLHAFTEDVTTYERMRRAAPDFLFGIGGVVTFKRTPLAEAVQAMQPEEILLETDCPYLTPTPFRGKRNESGYISYICRRVAELKGLTEEEVAAQTTRNAEALFGL